MILSGLTCGCDAGNWPTNARPVMEKADQVFALFFLAYVTIIVFALIRVISAIFLKVGTEVNKVFLSVGEMSE